MKFKSLCPKCGSDNLHGISWVDLKTGKPTCDEPPSFDVHCVDCGETSSRPLEAPAPDYSWLVGEGAAPEVRDHNGELVCKMAGSRSADELYLIAAAPDMALACQLLIDTTGDDYSQAINAAIAAISKVEDK